MNKFIILTPQDMVDWGGSNLPFSQIRAIGTDGSGVFVLTPYQVDLAQKQCTINLNLMLC